MDIIYYSTHKFAKAKDEHIAEMFDLSIGIFFILITIIGFFIKKSISLLRKK